MEKGLKPSSLPTANSELLAFLWRSRPVLMAQPKRLNRISELQMTRRSSFRKQTHTIVVSFSFYKSEATGLVQEREMVWSESNAGKRLHFSFVSNRAPCVSAQTLSRVSQLCPLHAGHVPTCTSVPWAVRGSQRHLASGLNISPAQQISRPFNESSRRAGYKFPRFWMMEVKTEAGAAKLL